MEMFTIQDLMTLKSTNTTDGLFYAAGDTSWGGNRFYNTLFHVRGHSQGWIDGLDMDIDLIFGDPQGANFVYDIYMCRIIGTDLTNDDSLFSDCYDTPHKVAEDINISKYWDNTKSSVTGRKYLQFDEPYLLNQSHNHIIIFDYESSTDFCDNASDSWLIRLDGVLTNNTLYKYVLELPNGTYNYNKSWKYLADVKLFSNFTYNYTFSDTSQMGEYILTVIANDSTSDINSTTTHFSICVPDWVCVNYSVCNTSDLQQCNGVFDNNLCNFSYTGDFSEFAPQSCNYCSEDIVKQYTSNCTWNGIEFTRSYIWADNNYYSCCVLTNITADCSILFSPYNESGMEACALLEDDFELGIDLEVYFGFGVGGLASDKVAGKIWLNDTNNTYYCLSYVKTTEGKLMQTNPPYTKRTQGLFQLIGKEIEDREFFVTQNGLANVYWTDNNLVIDGRDYIFGVECSGGGNKLNSERLSKVFYDPVNAPITRWFWLRENAVSLFLGFLVLIFLILFVAWAIYRLRRG